MAGIRAYQSPSGQIGSVEMAPLGVSQTYDIYDPVYIVADQLTVCPKNGSVILDSEIIGFAAQPATGHTAASRSVGDGALEDASSFANQGDVGAATNAIRTFIRLERGQLWATHNFWTTAAATTQDVVGGGDLQTLFQISSAAAGDWGLVDAAATIANEVAARLVHVIDTNGVPFTANTADTTCTGNASGPLLVFEIANLDSLTQLGGVA